MLARLLLFSLILTPAHAQEVQSAAQPLISRALDAVGGKEKLLKVFRMQEQFHSGESATPPEGKKPGTRTSFIQLPATWWVGKKERGEEAAKDDVRAWSLDLLVDTRSKFELLPTFDDEGVKCQGIRISGSVTPAMELYFDATSHLLHRLDWRNDLYRFSDWKELDGLKYAAHTVIIKKKTGKPWFHHDILSIERLVKLPEM
jgi:hypothetical protein